MDLKGKLALEQSEEPCIRLYHEGIFYVAYNHSALRFVKLFGADTKILKHVRKDGTWYLRIGIVQTSSRLSAFPIKDNNGNYVDSLTVSCQPVSTSLDECTPDRVVTRHKTVGSARADNVNELNTYSDKVKTVVDEICSLNLGLLTPVQAMVKIESWQHKLMVKDE